MPQPDVSSNLFWYATVTWVMSITCWWEQVRRRCPSLPRLLLFRLVWVRSPLLRRLPFRRRAVYGPPSWQRLEKERKVLVQCLRFCVTDLILGLFHCTSTRCCPFRVCLYIFSLFFKSRQISSAATASADGSAPARGRRQCLRFDTTRIFATTTRDYDASGHRQSNKA
jgi:hypothetical protein